MSVREGGSYRLDPTTGELTPNLPADAAGDTNTREGRSGTAREAPSADSGSTDAPASAPADGAQPAAPSPIVEEAASADLATKSRRRKAASEET